MPADGIYLSNDSYAKLQGDLFEQDARGTIADEWHRQATAAIPSLVADAQDRVQQQSQQAAQAQRDAMADTFLAGVPDALSQHLGNAPASESLQNGPPATPESQPPQTTPADLNAAPAAAPQDLTPLAPVTAPLPNPPSATQKPLTPVQPATQTTAALSGGGDLSGQVGARGQQIMASAADSASWLGQDGQRALQAVLLTEGGLAGARGDSGRSAGPLQFFEGGQLANFAQQHGLSLDQAKAYVEANPEEAVRWAIGTPDAPGYLGRAIQAGQQAGLKGADLATYAQQHGQVSVSPERAGQNWNALFGGAGQAIANSGAGRVVTAAVNAVVGALRPSQFGVGLSDAEAYAACGPVAAMAFARATGQNPTAEQALALAKHVGWTPGQGMAGPGSELDLLKSMGVAAHMEQGADVTKIAQDVQNGNPVIISTPGHYFVADGYDPKTGSFHVGTSGTDLKAGSEWMSLDQMQRVMGSAQATLYLDRQPGDGPSVAAQASQAATQPAPATPAQLQPSMWDKLGTGISDVFKNIFGNAGGQAPQTGIPAVDALTGGINLTDPTRSAVGNNPVAPASSVPTTGQLAGTALMTPAVQDVAFNGPIGATNDVTRAATGAVGGAMSDLGQTGLGQAKAEYFPSILDPNHPANVLTDPNATDEQKQNALFAVVAGIEGGGISGSETMGLLAKAEQAVADLRARFPQMSEGSLAASGAGQQLAALREAAAQAPVPTLGSEVAATLPPGSGPLAAPVPAQESMATLQGLLQMAKSRGIDTSSFEAHLPKAALPETPAVPRPTATPAGPLSLKPVAAGGEVPPPPRVPNVPPETPPPPPPGTLPATVGAMPPSVPTGGANAWDYLRALRVGSLAGGVQTIGHILLNAPLQTAFKLMSDAPLSVTRPETIPLEFMGAWQGLRGWATNAARAPLGQPGAIAQSIGGTAGNVVETGLLGLVKTHPVLQNMAHDIGASMELWRQAGIEASNAGMARFSGPWWIEVQNLVANPTAVMAAAAEKAGDTFGLRGAMGESGKAFADLMTSDWGQKWGRFIVPFFNIGYQVAVQGIERSPVGLLGTGIDTAMMALGKGPYAGGAVAEGVTPLAQRFRNNMVGTGLAVEAFHQASQGNITGNGPDDPRLKQDLLATGWQPDSIRIGGRYFPLHVLGPEGWPLAEAANLYETTHTGDQGGYAKPNASLWDQFSGYAQRMAQYGENETFLRGIGQILQAVGSAKDFGRLGEQEAASLLGSLVPQGALLANAASTVDPYTRRATPGDIGQAIQNRLPVLRQDLPLKLTPTGQPMQNAAQGLGILLPRSTIAAPDPVITAMGQAGIGAPIIPKAISVTSKYQMDLTPDEQQRWQELHGQLLNDQLKDVVTDPDWAKLSIDRQRQLIQRAEAKASDLARKQLLDEMPDSQIESRAQLKTDAAAGNRVTVGGGP